MLDEVEDNFSVDSDSDFALRDLSERVLLAALEGESSLTHAGSSTSSVGVAHGASESDRLRDSGVVVDDKAALNELLYDPIRTLRALGRPIPMAEEISMSLSTAYGGWHDLSRTMWVHSPALDACHPLNRQFWAAKPL